MKSFLERATISLLTLTVLAGCSSVPERRVVPEGFAPPGTPVEVRLLWDGAGAATFYNQTQGGATADLVNGGGILAVLLLPVTLAIDAGIATSSATRARQARRLADSVTGLPDREAVESSVAEALRADLGWVAPYPPGSQTAYAPPSPGDAPRVPLVLSIAPVFAMRQDARAMLFEFRLSVCRADGVFEGKMCADDRPLETVVLIHSDALPQPGQDDSTRARLAAIIDALYDVEGLSAEDGTAQRRARDKALERAHDKTLSSEEATLLAVDAWVADGGARLKEAFAATMRQFAVAVRAMRDRPGPPQRNKMSATRVIFPTFYDDEVPIGNLDPIEVDPDGRRLLRSRIEPMRGAGEDPVGNLWFSCPGTDRRQGQAGTGAHRFPLSPVRRAALSDDGNHDPQRDASDHRRHRPGARRRLRHHGHDDALQAGT